MGKKKPRKKSARQKKGGDKKSQKLKKSTAKKAPAIKKAGTVTGKITHLNIEEKTVQKEQEVAVSPKKENKKTKTLLAAGIIFIIVVLGAVEAFYHNRVLANTTIGPIDIGGLKYSEAVSKTEENIKSYLYRPFLIGFEGDYVQMTAEELGIEFPLDETASTIPIFSINKNTPIELIKSFFSKNRQELIFKIDEKQAISSIENKFRLKSRKARSAGFNFENGELIITPESQGAGINANKLMAQINENVAMLKTEPYEIELIIEDPRVTKEEILPEKDRLLETLKRPVKLVSESRNYEIIPIDYIDAVRFTEKSQIALDGVGENIQVVLPESITENNSINVRSKIEVEIDPGKMGEYLHEKFIKYLEVETTPASIYKNEAGKIIIDGKATDGKSVPLNALAEAIALGINNGISEVPVPIITEQAPISVTDELKEMGITELLATGHSAYYGSPPNRMFNIKFGTAKYDGILIAPGAEFSFNDLLGEVEAGSGFKPEKVIKQDKLELEYGGGICQVSTTMYRAALLTGLPITARKPHSWKVSYYSQSMGDGLDATIYPGVSDLKFINDMPSHILVQAYTEGAEAWFKFYGTADGRITELKGPFGSGLSYRWKRTITKDGQQTIEDIWSKYKPIPPPPEEEDPAKEANAVKEGTNPAPSAAN